MLMLIHSHLRAKTHGHANHESTVADSRYPQVLDRKGCTTCVVRRPSSVLVGSGLRALYTVGA